MTDCGVLSVLVMFYS